MTGYANILRQADIFFHIADEQLEHIAGLCSERTFQTGEIIFPEGSSSSELYVIVQGEVDILVDPALVSGRSQHEIQPVTIATLRRGQSFGEIALVDPGLRSATARAIQNNTRLLILPRVQLLEYCAAELSLGYQLMQNLAADLALKMRSSDLLIREKLLYSQ